MLIEKSYSSKQSSIYKCDRCKKTLISKKDEIYLVVGKETNAKRQCKRWHLCKRCFILFYRAIERGVNK